MNQLSFSFDAHRCSGCMACIVACQDQNDFVAEGTAFRHVVHDEKGTYPSAQVSYFSLSCLHCGDAPCLMVCPTSAISKRDHGGMVMVDRDLCIGCHSCLLACPYGAPKFTADGKMAKCDFCSMRMEHGMKPACVRVCTTRALDFKPLDKPPQHKAESTFRIKRRQWAMKPKEQRRQDTMSSPERMEALMRRQPMDRVPFLPFAAGFCAVSTGMDIKDIYEDAEKSFRAQMWTQEIFEWDGAPVFGYASHGGWEFGGDIKMPAGEWEQAPVVTRFPVTTPDDVDALVIPEVEKAGCYPNHLRFSMIQQQFGMPISVFGMSPFTSAGNICGVDTLCRWMMKMPDVAHRLVGKVLEFHKKVIDCFVEKFPNHPMVCFLGEPTTSSQVISPNHFKEFALPYIKEAAQYTIDQGVAVSFHICGEQNLNLPAWTEVNFGDPGICSFGHEVDLSKAVEMFGNKNIIAGNVDPSIIQTGTGQQVYALSKACIEKAKHAPSGFALMPGCECPVYAPAYNVYAMKKAVMDYGFYH